MMSEDKLTEEERGILDAFEGSKLRRTTDADAEHQAASEAARNTFNNTRRVNLQVTERDFSLAHSRAREEGIPYQTLLSSVVRKYLSGRLVEKQ